MQSSSGQTAGQSEMVEDLDAMLEEEGEEWSGEVSEDG